jgi:voltage-dependent anion channel protein 2
MQPSQARLACDGFAVGGELAFDTASGNITKYSAGLNVIKPDFNASLTL